MALISTRCRLLACDLDGTLLDSSGAVTGPVSAALHRLRRSGAAVAVITARPRRDLPDAVRRAMPPGTYWAFSNGGQVLRPGAEAAARWVAFEPRQVDRLTRRLRAAYPDWLFAVDLPAVTVVEDGYPEDETRRWLDVVRVPRLSVTEPVLKLLGRPPGGCDPALVAEVQDFVGDRARVVASTDRYVELGPPGGGKDLALRWIADDLGIGTAATVAVGDGLNDLPMLRAAGLAAVPANAPAVVRREAGLLLPDNDRHAVAVLVDHLLDDAVPAGSGPP